MCSDVHFRGGRGRGVVVLVLCDMGVPAGVVRGKTLERTKTICTPRV